VGTRKERRRPDIEHLTDVGMIQRRDRAGRDYAASNPEVGAMRQRLAAHTTLIAAVATRVWGTAVSCCLQLNQRICLITQRPRVQSRTRFPTGLNNL
jgi:hypothetical protein